MVPVGAVLLSAIFVGDRLGLNQIAGMIGIALALAAIDGRVFRLFPRSMRSPQGAGAAGRGLTPRWMTALEKKGKKRDSFLIQAQRPLGK